MAWSEQKRKKEEKSFLHRSQISFNQKRENRKEKFCLPTTRVVVSSSSHLFDKQMEFVLEAKFLRLFFASRFLFMAALARPELELESFTCVLVSSGQ
jgi:hypothetical protein